MARSLRSHAFLSSQKNKGPSSAGRYATVVSGVGLELAVSRCRMRYPSASGEAGKWANISSLSRRDWLGFSLRQN